jgi:hypothetical protein
MTMYQRLFVLISLLWLPTGAPEAKADDLPWSLKLEQPWQSGKTCGPNALYVLLNVHHKSIVYGDLLERLAPPEEGNSLLELQSAAGASGLKTEVLKTTRKGLTGVPRPFIAHLALEGNKGHFVLVLDMHEQGIKVVDGTQGQVVDAHPEMFFRYWSGYVLATRPHWGKRALTLVVVCEVVALALLFLWPIAHSTRTRLRGLWRYAP